VRQHGTELEEFFDLSVDPLSIIGIDGELKRVNASFVRLLGYPEPELFSRSAFDFLHPDDVARAREAMAQHAEGHDLPGFEARVICADGSVRWLDWRTRSVPERGVVYSVGRDTTERRRVEVELREAQRLLEASRDELHVLAEEQAALRRVATLVAQDVPSRELFGAVAGEVGVLLGADLGGMIRYEDDGTVTAVATWAAVGEHPPMPERWPIEPGDPAWMILESRAATRVEDWASVPGPFAEAVRNSFGVSASVGCPIVVEGRLWGALAVHSKQRQPLRPDTESRIAQFTDLVGTAIANAESRGRANRLAEEQATLRRLATLVAQQAPLEVVFAKVAEEVARTLGDVDSALWRDDGDRTVTAVAARGPSVAPGVRVGTQLTLDGDSVIALVLREGRPHRIDDFSQMAGSVAERARELGMRSAVGCPIVVGSRTWGAMTVATYEAEALAPETETRVARFSELVATAIANSEARAEVERLAAEQAALRRVATLVAEGASPDAVLDAVAVEMERALGADAAILLRYEPDEEVTVVAGRVPDPQLLALGTRVSHEGENVTALVRRTGRPARLGNYAGARGPVADLARAGELNIRTAVGAPVVVEGKLWGVIVATWADERSPPGDTEERMAKFAQMLDTAIANADSRDQLMASRARLLTAGDEARRRVVRDLHDGAQQRLVQTIVTLKLAQQAFRDDDGEAESLVSDALDQSEQCNRELRELAHGILPSVLTHGGLRGGVDAVVARLSLPVRVDVLAERLPAEIEASAYFIVAEALTNVVKHSRAARAEVTASLEDGMLRIAVRDNGTGGADCDGHGLVGMRDRVTTLGGQLEIDSPAGAGTVVAATLPLSAAGSIP
jgi:PAS domain S-box-containing protein